MKKDRSSLGDLGPVLVIGLVFLVLAWSIPGRAAMRFYALGDLPGGTFESSAGTVSEDGSTVVGTSNSSNSQFEAFRWTKATGMTTIPNLPIGIVLRGAAASRNLLRIAGSLSAGGNTDAVRWTSGLGLESVGDLPGGGEFIFATGISPDGNVVVGASNSTNGREAFRWTSSGGSQGLGDISGGDFFSQANDASEDGSIIVGVSTSASGDEAFLWKQNVGTMQGLGDLAGGTFFSVANAVSANGAVVVGSSSSTAGTQAFRWTTGLGMQGLGDLPGGVFSSSASEVTADGTVIVGQSSSAAGSRAVYWDANLQIHVIQDALAAAGVEPTGWQLTFASGISDNARHIVGSGINPTGNYEAWLVSMLPDPPTIALTGKPKVRAKSNGKFRIRGTADDDAAVTRVEYKLGGKGPWKKCRGTNKWLISAKLKDPERSGKLLIRSVDEDGQTSGSEKVKVQPAA